MSLASARPHSKEQGELATDVRWQSVEKADRLFSDGDLGPRLGAREQLLPVTQSSRLTVVSILAPSTKIDKRRCDNRDALM